MSDDDILAEGYSMNVLVSRSVLAGLQDARNNSDEPATDGQKTVDRHLAACIAQIVTGFGE
jgi:hypothetical protein